MLKVYDKAEEFPKIQGKIKVVWRNWMPCG